jgi:hypothetical protein
MENTFDTEFKWVTKVVSSTQNLDQLDTSRNCYTSFLRKHKGSFDRNPSLYEKVSVEFNNLYYERFLELR